MNPALWNEPAELEIRNTDTLTLRDAVIFVRSNDRSADDTLTVRIVTVSPDSLRCSETLLLGMERTNGPASLARESATPYRRRIRFSHRGTYRITITPLRPARGIEAIGIDIVKSE